MTTEQAANYGTLVGVFLVAVFAQWNARRANKKAEQIHTLVNGGRLQDLSNLASLTKRISEITKDPVDAAAHDLAVKNLEAHKDSYNPRLTTTNDPSTTSP